MNRQPGQHRFATTCRAVAGLTMLALHSPSLAEPSSQPPGDDGHCLEAEACGASAHEQAFWAAFGDPQIVSFIDLALRNNSDLQVLAARLDESRAATRGGDAVFLPAVSLAQTGSVDAAAGNAGSGTGFAVLPALQASYEIDLSGRNRLSRSALAARTAAAEHDLAALQLVIAGDVARSMIRLSALEQERVVLASQVAAFQNIQRIVALRLNEREIRSIDANLVAQQAAAAEAELLAILEEAQRLHAGLAVLTGQSPEGFSVLPAPLDLLTVPAIAPNQPAFLALGRPDLAAAEALLAAARLDAKSVRASLVPNLQLSAQGLGANLANGLGGLLSLGGTVAALLFDGGRRRAQQGVADARAEAAMAQYRGTALRAFQDVAVSLFQFQNADRRARLWFQATKAGSSSAQTAQQLYLEGESTIVELNQILRLQSSAERAAATARRDVLLAAVDVFKAMGAKPLLGQ